LKQIDLIGDLPEEEQQALGAAACPEGTACPTGGSMPRGSSMSRGSSIPRRSGIKGLSI
jgi:hypothetical protein